MNGEPDIRRMKEDLALMIEAEVMDEFSAIHLSRNLMETMSVYSDGDGDFVVTIPAIRYDIGKYRAEKVVVHQPERGSYAEQVNRTGGFSRTHTGYVEKAIYEALRKWAEKYGIGFEKKERL